MIIDFHTHAYPDKIASRAIETLCKTGGMEPATNGTLSDLREKLTLANVDYGVMLPIATKPTQEQVANDWASERNNGNIISFGTVYPRKEGISDVISELERIKSLGLKGIKLHPDYQKFFLFEEHLLPIWATCERLGLIIVLHMGYDAVSPLVRHAMPCHLADIANKFPKLLLVGAHLGGMCAFEETLHYIAGRSNTRNVWLDTADLAGHIEPEMFAAIVRKHSSERIVFGSDCPFSTIERQINLVQELKISDSEKDNILGKSAKELLNIS